LSSMTKMSQWREALADVQASLELHPSHAKALRTRARINVHDGNYEAAIEDFKLALESTTLITEKETLRSELKHAEMALVGEQGKPKDYYKILGIVLIKSRTSGYLLIIHLQRSPRRAPLLSSRKLLDG
jgi:tetratricopeptide (TPR) repeat protein